MKTTPFQQALKNELSRIERLSCNQEGSSFALLSFRTAKPAKNKHFLVQFFQHVLSF